MAASLEMLPARSGLRRIRFRVVAIFRARIKGRDAIAQIPAAYETLQASGEVRSDGRPWFEFYRRHDCVDVLVPI
jgi:hypothetical protein